MKQKAIFIFTALILGQSIRTFADVDPAVDLMCRADAREAAARIYKACLSANSPKEKDLEEENLLINPPKETPSPRKNEKKIKKESKRKNQKPLEIELPTQNKKMEFQSKTNSTNKNQNQDDSVMDIPDPIPIEQVPSQ